MSEPFVHLKMVSFEVETKLQTKAIQKASQMEASQSKIPKILSYHSLNSELIV